MSSSLLMVLKADAVVELKAMLKVQEAPPARELPQLLVCENAVLLMVIEDKYKGASPRLVSVTVWGSPVVPTTCPVNARDEPEREPRAGAPAVPRRGIAKPRPVVACTRSTAARTPSAVGVTGAQNQAQ